jgi:hypothetical protein
LPRPLASLLRDAAAARGLALPGEHITPARAFELVRDLPYARASGRDPEKTIHEWRGTCSAKHELLKALFEELGLDVLLIAARHEFTSRNTPWLPAPLLAMVDETPVPDVHHFLRVATPDGDWSTVDATWPLAARRLGLPANERYEPGRDMTVACDPDEIVHVPDETDPREFKNRMLAELAPGDLERRERFIDGLIHWLGEQLPRPPAPLP